MPRADDRFWASTRGRVLTFLRKGPHSVTELASALGLTSNAIRAHLATLERDGLVRTSGMRRGTRKPAATYDLAPKAEQLFPKAQRAYWHICSPPSASLSPTGRLKRSYRRPRTTSLRRCSHPAHRFGAVRQPRQASRFSPNSVDAAQ